MSGSRTGMPAPVKGRYAEQMLNLAPQALRPVGGFNTSDGAMSRIKSSMALHSRLAGLEQRLMEQRVDAASDAIKVRGKMAEDSTAMRLQTLNASEKVRNEERKLGFFGTVATGLDIAGTAYDAARSTEEEFEDSRFGKAAGKFADALGKIRPMRERMHRSMKKTEAFHKKMLARAEADDEANQKIYRETMEILELLKEGIDGNSPEPHTPIGESSMELGMKALSMLLDYQIGGPR